MRSILDRTILDSLLARTEIEYANIYRADEVARWPKALHRRLLELGLLREIERATSVWCNQCLDDGDCIVDPEIEVDPETGKIRGYWLCQNGPVNFDEDEFRRFEFQLDRLAHMVAEAVGTHGAVTEVVPKRVYLLGIVPTGGGPLELFLASGVRLPDGQDVLARANRLRTSAAPVLIVTEHSPQTYPWPGFQPTVLVLSELAKWNDADMTIDFTPLVNMVGTLRPPVPEDAWLTVTDAAKLLQRDFPGLELERAKARVSWAAGAGKVETNGKTRGTRRIARISFDAWRLAQRDRDLDEEDGEDRFERVSPSNRRRGRE